MGVAIFPGSVPPWHSLQPPALPVVEYRQIHRIGPDVVDFKGETAREERKKLLLHRLFDSVLYALFFLPKAAPQKADRNDSTP